MTIQAQTDDARRLIAATDTAWAELEVVVGSSERVTLHGDDAHDWSAADVYAHLGRWFVVAGEVITRHLAGEREIHEFDDSAGLNLGWIKADRALDTAAARAQALDALGELEALVAGVDESRMNRFILGWTRGNGVEHVREHLKYVAEAAGIDAPPEALKRLERDRQSWAEFVAALDARPGVPLHDPESPDWTSREIFGHFAHWTEFSVESFEAQLASQEPPRITTSAEEQNAIWAAEDQALDLDELRARALRAFGKRAQLIVSTPASRWTPSMLATIAEDGYDHIAEHHRYIGG